MLFTKYFYWGHAALQFSFVSQSCCGTVLFAPNPRHSPDSYRGHSCGFSAAITCPAWVIVLKLEIKIYEIEIFTMGEQTVIRKRKQNMIRFDTFKFDYDTKNCIVFHRLPNLDYLESKYILR